MKKWANELNRTFSKEEVQMTKIRHMKKCSISLAMKKIQIKIMYSLYKNEYKIFKLVEETIERD
jgi:hypothetical protein